MSLFTADHPTQVYRVGRDDPWAIRPPRFHNRFDISDAENPVMTLYTGESPEAALAEVLAPLRPDLELVATLAAIPSDDGLLPHAGRVPANWLARRQMGCAEIRSSAVIADITSAQSIAALRSVPELAEKAIKCGFTDVDDSSLIAGGPQGRPFTQTVAAYLYNLHYSGIRYGSRLGAAYHCIAGFISIDSESVTESGFICAIGSTTAISPDDPALRVVMETFGLRH
jgi:hypothetical protein